MLLLLRAARARGEKLSTSLLTEQRNEQPSRIWSDLMPQVALRTQSAREFRRKPGHLSEGDSSGDRGSWWLRKWGARAIMHHPLRQRASTPVCRTVSMWNRQSMWSRQTAKMSLYKKKRNSFSGTTWCTQSILLYTHTTHVHTKKRMGKHAILPNTYACVYPKISRILKKSMDGLTIGPRAYIFRKEANSVCNRKKKDNQTTSRLLDFYSVFGWSI